MKGHLRLKMTYLPENPGSEEDTTDQSEDVSLTNAFLTRGKYLITQLSVTVKEASV